MGNIGWSLIHDKIKSQHNKFDAFRRIFYDLKKILIFKYCQLEVIIQKESVKRFLLMSFYYFFLFIFKLLFLNGLVEYSIAMTGDGFPIKLKRTLKRLDAGEDHFISLIKIMCNCESNVLLLEQTWPFGNYLTSKLYFKPCASVIEWYFVPEVSFFKNNLSGI